MDLVAPAWLALGLLAPALLWLARRRGSAPLRVPSIAFVPPAAAGAARRPRWPPLAAWLSAGALVCAAVALAGPSSSAGALRVLVIDGSARMARVSVSGGSRWERARAVAGAEIADARSRGETVEVHVVPGRVWHSDAEDPSRGLAGFELRRLGEANPSAVARSALARGADVDLLTGSNAAGPEGVRVRRFGGAPGNLGIVGVQREDAGRRLAVLVACEGPVSGACVLAHGSERASVVLEPGEVRRVVLSAEDGATTVRLVAAEGFFDALALDDEAVVGSAGWALLDVAATPPLLRDALTALGVAEAAPGGTFALLACVAEGSAPRGEHARIVRSAGPYRARSVEGAAGSALAEIAMPARVRAGPVAVDRALLLDRETGEPLAGTSGSELRLGLDLEDPALETSALLPVLLAEGLEQLDGSAWDAGHDRLASVDPEALEDSVDVPDASRGHAGRAGRATMVWPWLAAAALALAAALRCGMRPS